MPVSQKIEQLLSHKYRTNIVVTTNDQNPKVVVITDVESGTMFWTIEASMYSFKDENDNVWVTPPHSVNVGDEKYQPKIGDHLKGPDGESCFFSSKEAVVDLAVSYFEKHIDITYGLQFKMSTCYFEDSEAGENFTYQLNYKKFKCSVYKGIKRYISFN
ncbi:hypothetical protein [Flavobacterium hercynium]|uniref:Uncharacterized protein n=1 Tax=Flavobacterium hercynium TaxID=387094 RepID=A0A226HMN9_9FLAO|nr:hypothetical protein [Flavobacterium hercynium]OXA94896.1 hypothetical protein B0A66_04020 [Flavobacterium hercynium]SMP09202.1 hypothetical protein SAMN06265346_102232 [Flavobacterium hercynium]